MKETWIAAIVAAAAFGIFYVLSERKFRDAASRLGGRRRSPSREEFIELLSNNCERDIAEFLWEELKIFYRPRLMPHPDDNFIEDLPIDHDEPNDWLARFCGMQGLQEQDFAPWPLEMPATIRNFATWLAVGRRRLIRASHHS